MPRRKKEVAKKPESELDWLNWYEYERRQNEAREEFLKFIDGKAPSDPLVKWLDEHREFE